MTMPTAGMTDPEYAELIRRIQMLHEVLDGVRGHGHAPPPSPTPQKPR